MESFRRYDDFAVGDIFPDAPLAFQITPGAVDAFLKATGGIKPVDKCEGGDRKAPSMLASVYLVDLLKARKSPPGGIHAKQSIRFFRSLLINETVVLQAKVVEKYRRKERPYMVAGFEARGDAGDLIATGRITTIWGKDL